MFWRLNAGIWWRKQKKKTSMGCALDQSSSGKTESGRIQDYWRGLCGRTTVLKILFAMEEKARHFCPHCLKHMPGRCNHSDAGNQWLQNGIWRIGRRDRKGNQPSSGSDSGICTKSWSSSDITDLSWEKGVAGGIWPGVFRESVTVSRNLQPVYEK